MYQVTITVPEETAQALKLTPEELAQELSLSAAVKLYELGKLSSGAAAQLAGIERVLTLCPLKRGRFFKTCLKGIVKYPARHSKQLLINQYCNCAYLLFFLLSESITVPVRYA